MVKPVHFSAVAFVTLSSVLGAWGQGFSSTDQKKTLPDLHFPFNPDQAWALEESLLVWRPYEDDTDYAVRTSLRNESPQLDDFDVRVKHPSFKWGTGVRLKLTRYLPSRDDPWDLDFIGTYYYSQGKDHVDINPANLTGGAFNESIVSPWDTDGIGPAARAKVAVNLNFFNFDFVIGRYYSLTRKIDIHPFIGIRSVLLFQDYKASYSSSIFPAVFALSNHSFKGEHNFWGVGPRIGTDLNLRFGRHWSLLATFGASLFAGRYNIKEKVAGSIVNLQALEPLDEKIRDKEASLRSNLDASIGLGWEKWIRNKTVRIAPSFAFEVSEWFAMKRWVDLHSFGSVSSPGPTIKSHRRYSDLGLMGFNVNLQIDF